MSPLKPIKQKPLVYLIDSDHDVLNALSLLLRLHYIEVSIFTSAEHFLQSAINSQAALMLVELNLPGKSAIDLIKHLKTQGYEIPTIVVATHSDVPTAVRAMQAKAIDFIEKPLIHTALIQQIKKLLHLR